jgi:hypothetical protein
MTVYWKDNKMEEAIIHDGYNISDGVVSADIVKAEKQHWANANDGTYLIETLHNPIWGAWPSKEQYDALQEHMTPDHLTIRPHQ